MKTSFDCGVYTASVTPMTKQGAIDEGAVGALVSYYAEAGLLGALFPSSTGEYFALTQEMRFQCVRAAVKHAPASFSILANISEGSERAAIENAKRAKEAGAAAVVLMPPSFHHHTQQELYRFFAEVANASELPLICYNHMTRLPNRLEEALVLQLEKHPNIIGIKDTHNDAPRLLSLREKLGWDSSFSVFVGGDGVTGYGSLLKMPMLNALSAIDPKLFLQLHSAGMKQDIESVCRLQEKVARLMKIFTVLRGGASSAALFSQAIKAALSLKGLCTTHSVQMGYELSAEDMDAVRALLNEMQG